ncbi:hypothetical protein KUTeg_006964 [Tegillarca granosa]|uniref:Uncharacterized protein n=1 Tax=Tegillarca granosa TaxID=220873 RepID=A0ABQ9FBV0_TEGGR|nr:hypothetical protein KUTeg_006964 [Tegillarca granosa]
MTIYVLILYIDLSSGHLCLLYPEQRGGFKYPLMYPFPLPSCAHYGEPCGGIKPEKPLRVFEAGKQAYVKWQQNMNIYDIGNPGYMDISIAPLNSSEFEVLAVVQDQNAFNDYVRQNISALIIVPNKECEHCVLRVRYKTNRPGELVYVQCADITIVTKPSSNVPVSNFPFVRRDYHELSKGFDLQNRYPMGNQGADGLTLYGFAYNPYEVNRMEYIKISLLTGMKEGIYRYNFSMESEIKTNLPSSDTGVNHRQDHYFFVADSVLSVDKRKEQTTLLYHSGDLEAPPATIVEVDTTNGFILRKKEISSPGGQSFSAIFPNDDGYFTFSIRNKLKGEYELVVGKLSESCVYSDFITTTGDVKYLNFKWAELNTDELMLKFMGQYKLKSPSMYQYFQGRKLYGLTSGYYGNYKYANWFILEIDTSNGNITQNTAIYDTTICMSLI